MKVGWPGLRNDGSRPVGNSHPNCLNYYSLIILKTQQKPMKKMARVSEELGNPVAVAEQIQKVETVPGPLLGELQG